MNTEMLQKMVQNRPFMIAFSLVAAVGAVIAIAGGFYATYQAITFLSNVTI